MGHYVRMSNGRFSDHMESPSYYEEPLRQRSSIFDMIDGDVPSWRSIRERDRWLYSVGKDITREDVLGIQDTRYWYSLLPLSRVWDWENTPYDPPLSAGDWYIVIMGMPESDFKSDFLAKLAYSLVGHTDIDSIRMALDRMRGSHLTLSFDISTNTYEIV